MGRYISLEAKIAKSKDLYYDALQSSQSGWHTGEDDPVPFIKYLLGTILAAYRDFEDRFSLVEKKLPALETVRMAAQNKIGRFTKQDIRELCPSLSISSVEGALRKLVASGELRRGEILGLKWDAIDFESNTFVIRHTVTQTYLDGKTILVQADRTKNKSSQRTMPLIPVFRERLQELKARQEENRKICGSSYNTEYLDYVFVDEMGNLFKPNYVSGTFKKLLKKNGLPEIRFHDLRHPYVKHTTKKYCLQKQKSQATASDGSLRFLLLLKLHYI